jgi:hypothetical protein
VSPETISDKEAAVRLGFPLRHLRKVMDAKGLCMKVGRRRRLTACQYEALKEALVPQCRSSSTRGRTASSISGGPSRGDALTRALERASVPEAEAIRAKLEADLFKRAVYGDRAVATFAEAADAYMVGGGATDHMTPLLHRIGNTPLRQIDQEFIDRLALDMKPDAKPSTRIRQVYTPIIAVLTRAAKKGLCDVPQVDKPEVDGGRVDYLTPVEADELLKLLPAHLKPLVTLYLATGCRASEGLGMEWRDVSPEAERVVFWDTKTNQPRGVNLQKRAKALLPARRKASDPVWLNSEGEPWHGYDAINLMLRSAIRSGPGFGTSIVTSSDTPGRPGPTPAQGT